MTRLAALTCFCLGSVHLACGGETSATMGGDDAGGVFLDAGKAPHDAGTTRESGALTVLGYPIPCGPQLELCGPPDVCCETQGLASPTCVAAGFCEGIAVGCTSSSCPDGAVCCASLRFDARVTGSAVCQLAAACVPGWSPLCESASDCAQPDQCMFPIGDAWGALEICEGPDGG